MNIGKIAIRRLQTGVPGLDEVLGGGIPEYSFNLMAGPLKVRGSAHSSAIRMFSIDDQGIQIGAPCVDEEGPLGGQPTRGGGTKARAGGTIENA